MTFCLGIPGNLISFNLNGIPFFGEEYTFDFQPEVEEDRKKVKLECMKRVLIIFAGCGLIDMPFIGVSLQK